jgi:hypothetical protein
MVGVNSYLFGAAFLAGHTRRVDRKGLLQATPYPISALATILRVQHSMRGVEDPVSHDEKCYDTLLEPGDRQCGREVIKGIQKALVPTYRCPPHRQISISFTLDYAIPLPYDLESAVTRIEPEDL